MNASTPSFNPWPVALIAFFAVFISGIVAFIVFASHHRMDLVHANYYEDEMRFQEQMDRVNRTRALTTGVAVVYDATRQSISIALPADHARRAASGHILFYRPSDAKLDRQFPLQLDQDGAQRLETGAMRAGRWTVRVQWKAGAEEFYFEQPIFISGHSS